MPPAIAPSPSGARRTPCWARRWGENVQWGMKAWSGNRCRGDLPMKKLHLHTSQKTNVVTNCTSPLPLSYSTTALCGGVYARCSRFLYHFAPNASTEPAYAPTESCGATKICCAPTDSYLHWQRATDDYTAYQAYQPSAVCTSPLPL